MFYLICFVLHSCVVSSQVTCERNTLITSRGPKLPQEVGVSTAMREWRGKFLIIAGKREQPYQGMNLEKNCEGCREIAFRE